LNATERRIPGALLGTALAALLFPGCAADKPDVFPGYYIGVDKTVTIAKAKPGGYRVLIRGASGREISMQAELSRGRLISEYADGFAIAHDSGAFYSMGNAEAGDPLRKTDSAGFAAWWDAVEKPNRPPEGGTAGDSIGTLPPASNP
jgi:hypothetical protein